MIDSSSHGIMHPTDPHVEDGAPTMVSHDAAILYAAEHAISSE
jgi:hypothetical protein